MSQYCTELQCAEPDALKPSDRLRLLAALSEQCRKSGAGALEDSYVDRLFRLADRQAPRGSLARCLPVFALTVF